MPAAERRLDRCREICPGPPDGAAERVLAAQYVHIGYVGPFEEIDIERRFDTKFDRAVSNFRSDRAVEVIEYVGDVEPLLRRHDAGHESGKPFRLRTERAFDSTCRSCA